jgi:uncharacterized membrane protein YbhN (UPF0104 family)
LPKGQDVRKHGRVSLVARLAVAGVAIVWVLHGQDWAELGRVLRRLSPLYFGLSLATFMAGQVVIALRWWLLLRAQSIHIAVFATLRLHFLGLFYNGVMPGSVGGDLLRAWYVAKHTDRRLEGVLSVLVDRVTGLAGLVLMAILAYLLFVRGSEVSVSGGEEGGGAKGLLGRYGGVILWIAAVGAAVFVLALVHPSVRRRVGSATGRLRVRAVGLLKRTWDALIVYGSKPATILCTLLLTFVAQSGVVVAFWLLGRDLGIAAEARHYFVVFPIMWVVGALPITISGLGVMEAGIVELFGRLAGVAAERALALALCQRFVWVLASLPGAVVHLLGAHLPAQEIFVDSQDPQN